MLFPNMVRRKELPNETPNTSADRSSRPVAGSFEPLADALLYTGDLEACATEVGLNLATDGVALDQALDDLEHTYSALGAGRPDYRVVRALCLAWNEVSLRYLHGLSCEDPLTGLASLPHLRSRLDELYLRAQRDGEHVEYGAALVMVEFGRVEPDLAGLGTDSLSARFSSELRLVEVAEALHTVFSGGETFARVSRDRVGALVTRDANLGQWVDSLRQLLADRSGTTRDEASLRVWIESLPATHELTTALLDELAR